METAARCRWAAGRPAAVFFTIVMLASLLTSKGVEGAPMEDMVTNLPGAPALNFSQYAGYITVNGTNERALFYWFFTADHPNASSLPLILWLNGGPGCSSVGNGLLEELGPFYPEGSIGDIHLTLNPQTWIKEANIIFLESPVSVGFSYSNKSSDYSFFTDKETAEGNLQFLLNWFKKFPEYSTNDFYILGESYAGHYIPTLAREVVNYNDAQGPKDFKINFLGYAIGNPWTDAYYNNYGATVWWHAHDLISDDSFDQIVQHCNFTAERPVGAADPSPLCQAISDATDTDFNYINPYSIYIPFCNSQVSTQSSKSDLRKAQEKAVGYLRAGSATDPCAPDLINAWLNTEDVKKALHVRTDIEWQSCSDAAFNNYSIPDILESMLPIHQEMIGRGLRVWIYSGDTDGVCPSTTSRMAISSLNLTLLTQWYPWVYDTQVGGFTQVYKGLTYTTIRDAGHFVPQSQPGPALSLLQHFLAGQELPSFPPVP